MGYKRFVCYDLWSLIMEKMMDKTKTLPPIAIYDVLHEAEKKGIELPKSVDDWWYCETQINENRAHTHNG